MSKIISEEIRKLLLDDIDNYETRNRIAIGVLCNIIGSCEVDENDSISYETILKYVKENLKEINK